MRFTATLLLSALAVATFSDVMPRCGGQKVVVQDVGQECGSHGPSWRGTCRGPASCFRLDGMGAICTIACASDGDCARLGAMYTCASDATRDDMPNDHTPVRVCKPPAR